LAEEEGEFAAGGKAEFSGPKKRWTDFLGPKKQSKKLGQKSGTKKVGRFLWVVRNF
jgi:hypothetical protein